MRVTEPSRFFVLDADQVRTADERLVPHGRAPARGAVLRPQEHPGGDRPARAAAGARVAVGRADPRAEQPGVRGRPRRRVAARAGRRHAAQAGLDRRAPAGPSRRSPRWSGCRRRRLPESPRRRCSARWRRPTARTPSPTGSTSKASPAAGTWRPCSPRRAWIRPGSTRSARPWRTAPTDPAVLDSSLRWIGYTVETELLMNEIEDSVTRISTLVGAAKQYSQLDRAPYQVVDVHELLDSTLMMLSGKMGDGITVVKDYDRGLPRIPAFPGELNQVWTNLIDNAVAAMERHRHADRPHRSGRRPATGRVRRHRLRHSAGHQGPDLRAVLHHQAGGPGHRAGAGHLLTDRRGPASWRPSGAVRTRGHSVPGAAPPHRPDGRVAGGGGTARAVPGRRRD